MMTRTRRTRTIRETLIAIVLGFEAIVVGLGALVIFGLKAVTPVQAFVGGGVIVLGLIAAIFMARWPSGVWLGWLLQVVVIMSGFLVGAMFVVGIVFTAMWIFALVQGDKIDNQKRLAAEQAEVSDESPQGSEGEPS